MPILAKDHRAHLVLFEVEGKAVGVVRKLEQLSRHRILQAVDLSDAVAGGHDPAHVSRHQAGVEILETFFDDLGDLFGADAHFLVPLPRTRPPGGGAAAATWWPGWRR